MAFSLFSLFSLFSPFSFFSPVSPVSSRLLSLPHFYPTNLPSTPGTRQIIRWNKLAAEHGHSDSLIRLARAYMNNLPWSPQVPYNPDKAVRLLEKAVENSDESGAHYALAEMLMQRGVGAAAMDKAIGHLEAASRGGHEYAMFNLGIAHLYGYGTHVRDQDLAGEWFEASQLPEGLIGKAMHSRSTGKEKEARGFERHARSLGFGSEWRVQARKQAGAGGAGGVNLNLPWPSLAEGIRPPPW